MQLRDLPSVDELARDVDDPLAVDCARDVLARAREEIRAGADPGDLSARLHAALEAARAPSLRRVLNATGVIVHTNLGRAPLGRRALQHVVDAATGYSNLELDLRDGERGSRQDHVAALLRSYTGAEAAVAVNNNAGALLLVLAALAEGREVIVSRSELIEIGDGFRIPDVLARSGAKLVEVGTTNRTRAADYERAITAGTALLLRVHQSNFRIVGFTEQPKAKDLAAIAHRHGLPFVIDSGSGPVEEKADLVCFSGDKLVGGPQAGIVAGRADLVELVRRHPLHRALRIDKLSLAALEGTLLASREEEPPVTAMLNQSPETIRARADRLAALVDREVVESTGMVGGGALPGLELPSFAVALDETLAAPLRAGSPPVIGVVRDGRLLLDCLTLADGEVDEVAALVTHAERHERPQPDERE